MFTKQIHKVFGYVAIVTLELTHFQLAQMRLHLKLHCAILYVIAPDTVKNKKGFYNYSPNQNVTLRTDSCFVTSLLMQMGKCSYICNHCKPVTVIYGSFPSSIFPQPQLCWWSSSKWIVQSLMVMAKKKPPVKGSCKLCLTCQWCRDMTDKKTLTETEEAGKVMRVRV